MRVSVDEPRSLRLAYADPPYLGTSTFGATHHYGNEAEVYDTLDGHRLLIERLCDEFGDGWAMSLSSPSLKLILPLCPSDCRIAAWVKPFCSFKPGVNPAYAWEPMIWRGGRSAVDRGGREVPTTRDYLSENIVLKKGLSGAKPEAFCRWVLEILGWQCGDEMVDLFPGMGVMGRVLTEMESVLQ